MADAKSLLENFAGPLMSQEYDAAAEHLAPWMKDRGLEHAMEAALREATEELEDFDDVDGIKYPDAYDVDNGPRTLAEIRDEYDDVPDAVNDDNFESWGCVRFEAEHPEFGPEEYLTVWTIVVRDAGELKVGYLQFDFD